MKNHLSGYTMYQRRPIMSYPDRVYSPTAIDTCMCFREGLCEAGSEEKISQEVIEEQFAIVLSRDYASLLGLYVNLHLHVVHACYDCTNIIPVPVHLPPFCSNVHIVYSTRFV